MKKHQAVKDERLERKVREVVIPADERALNQALIENQIEPDKIIAVMLQQGQSMAIGDHGPKYRVVYRL